ncbi:sigma-54-dependent Fis family transcriptional regulator [candidate division KSB1 bacterium]|nr:sigma-54-dependent Fis family transcriptional regulator [candidate division KSB1 bacterium]RQW06737.1 MAG: sigma-54-dependent Fis family transcriptional regulator [candidate division KSB1 bacterium]
MAIRILIVDDDDITRESLATVLNARGFVCAQAENGKIALSQLTQHEFDVVISDIEMPEMDGIELLEATNQLLANTSFIFITAHASVQTAIEALRKGAYDYLLKPLNFEDLAIKVKKLIEHKELIRENQVLRNEIHAQYDFSNIIGESPAIRRVFETIKKVSDSESNVLITGNSGTGKELVAKAIHYNSPHQRGRFIAVNCGAITETLIESELFGHKKGAFTGAVSDKEGLFKAAERGTLFLDEIGELSLTAQTKLLRAIDNEEILPVGSARPIPVHTRVIAATNIDLERAVSQGRFRNDLYYRLNVIDIKLPSLKDRREDIPLLIRHFIQKYNRQMNKSITAVQPRLMQTLIAREWKGEVRELENYIERLMIFASGSELTMETLPPESINPIRREHLVQATTLKKAVEEFERRYIIEQLTKNKYHRSNTAKALGIGEATLYRKMNQLGIEEVTTT